MILKGGTAPTMSHSTQLLCSTGAFSRYPDHTGYQAVLTYGPQLAVDGFELMFYPSWYTQIERVARDLQDSGLAFPAIHTEKNIGSALGQSDPLERERGVQLLAENCRLGSLLGSKVLILHLWNWPNLDDNLDNNLQVLGQCLDITAQYGQALAIETIPGRHFDPLKNVQRAFACDSRCTIALDTEFLATYDQLSGVFETPWLWQQNLVRHVHIKDFDGRPFVDGQRRYLQPGEGMIDFPLFFARLKQSCFAGSISLEAPAIYIDGQVDIARLRESLAFIRQLMQA